MAPVTDDPKIRALAPKRRSRRLTLLEVTLVICVLGGFVTYAAPGLGEPLLERHGFRQAQTAFTARIFHERGIDLLHPKVPVLGNPFELPFEFPLFQAGASLVMDAGVEDDTAMRLTALGCFVLTALLLYGLVRHVAGRVSAVAALAAFALTPFSFLWARASLIEYLATAGAIGFAWATILWRERGRPLPGALALVAGAVGMLVKPTTAVFWIAPALAYRPNAPARESARREQIWTASLVLVPLAAALAWTRYADAIKAANETTSWLVSTNLREWTLGTLAQRLDPETWLVISGRIVSTLLGLYGAILIVAAVFATVRARQRGFWLSMWFAAAAPVLVFTNLYFQHDYYLAAVAPAFAGLIGLGAGFLWSRLPSHAAVRAVAVSLGLVLVLATLELSRGYWSRIDDAKNDSVLPLAREVAQLTRSDELVAVVAYDWDPALLYYARRWGHTVTERDPELAYDSIRRNGYRYLLVVDPARFDPAALGRWPWLGVVGQHSYSLADSPLGLRRAQIVATDVIPASGKPLASDIRVRCGATTRISVGREGTWILSTSRSRASLVFPASLHPPLPPRRAIFAAHSLARAGELELSCRGAPAIVVELVDAPGPQRN